MILNYDLNMYNYKIKKTDNYKVLLKPNDFYETETLESGNYYPSMAVKNYIINFDYNFEANKKSNLEYNYNVTAELVGTCSSAEGQYEDIWVRNFNVLETKYQNINDSSFAINEEVSIDFEYYKNLVLAYEETYGVQIDGVLKVRFNMEFLNLNGKKMKDYIELDINLNEDITNLEENYQQIKTNKVSEISETSDNFKGFEIFAICIIIVISIISLINKIRRNTPEDKHKRRVKRILKYCKDLIITVKEKPILKNLETIELDNFNSLINLAEQTKSNIIYYETIKDRESEFFVINNNYVYIYLIKIENS